MAILTLEARNKLHIEESVWRAAEASVGRTLTSDEVKVVKGVIKQLAVLMRSISPTDMTEVRPKVSFTTEDVKIEREDAFLEAWQMVKTRLGL